MAQPSRGTLVKMDTTVASKVKSEVHDMYPKNLWNMLNQICDGPFKDREIIYLETNDRGNRVEKRQSYLQLRKDVWEKSFMLRNWRLMKYRKGDGELNRIIVLHFDNYYESITWFWAVIALGWIPCMSIPLKGSLADHDKYILGLRKLLDEPTFLTNANTAPLFQQFANTGIRVFRVSQLQGLAREPERIYAFPGGHQVQDEVAMIMLTSGSTGVSKAVAIKHRQILHSIGGKQEMFRTTASDKFLSWTDFSHVANLVEIHLHALRLGALQVHVESSEIVSKPLRLLELVNQYRISYTFAPNFLLASLVKELRKRDTLEIQEDWFDRCESMNMNKVLEALAAKNRCDIVAASALADLKNHELHNRDDTRPNWDLGCLRALISGGESNVVDTCVKLTDMLQQHNAPWSFIRPGFGMTETCAGCIYSTSCPKIDVECGLEFACLGEPTFTTKVRIMRSSGEECAVNEVGGLQLNGLALFTRYYNDPVATAEAFTKDGWFKTGDVARLDELKQLHIEGRVKDTLVINGVNHYPHAIEAALEDAKIEGMRPSFTAIFPYRPINDKNYPGTECMCIVYLPTYDHFNIKARIETHTAISKTVVLYSGVRPYKILPLSDRVLAKSVLGKLSRSSIRACFERGDYKQFEREDERLIQEYQKSVFTPASTETEKIIIEAYNAIFSAAVPEFGVHCNIFSLGVSSGDLLRMRVNLMQSLKITFPITVFFAHPTIAELGAALDKLNSKAEYNPVVVLQPKTDRTTKLPIFFIHPGMGEVLIFMNLARHIDDRPVYALRARGFDGEPFFKDIDEMIESYHKAIKKTQPKGPYALAGYSFGSILTWEIAKRMIAAGDEVKFLGTFDQAPFLKDRSRGYDWYECVVSVAFFLGLMEEGYAYAQLPHFRTLTRQALLGQIMANAPPAKLCELGLDQDRLARWADLALAMKKITWDYDPKGIVPHMDIFWTVPLIGIVKAKTTEEWRDKYIHQWDQLVGKPEYHFVGGGHRTMITPPHLNTFQKIFREVLDSRGV